MDYFLKVPFSGPDKTTIYDLVSLSVGASKRKFMYMCSELGDIIPNPTGIYEDPQRYVKPQLVVFKCKLFKIVLWKGIITNIIRIITSIYQLYSPTYLFVVPVPYQSITVCILYKLYPIVSIYKPNIHNGHIQIHIYFFK